MAQTQMYTSKLSQASIAHCFNFMPFHLNSKIPFNGAFNMSTSMISTQHPTQELKPSLLTTAGYQILDRMANVFCNSQNMVPPNYRNNKANCIIACNMAARMNVDPVTVMQNLYVIQGKPSWSSQFLIGMWNTCGRFTPIRYEWSPDRKSCRATSMEIKTGDVLIGTTITMNMAKAEGWIDKPGSKWKTMPEQMLMYRAAAFMIRAYAAEIALGLLTVEEGEDITGKHAIEYTEPNAVPSQAMVAQVELSNDASQVVDSVVSSAEEGEVINVESEPKLVAGEPVQGAVTVKDGVVTNYKPPLFPAGSKPTGGTFTVSGPGGTSGPIAANAGLTEVQSAIDKAQGTIPQPSASISNDAPVSTNTLSYLGDLVKELNPPKDIWKKSLKNKYGVESARELTEAQAQKVIAWAKEKVDAKRLNNWATGATTGAPTGNHQQKAGATVAETEAAPFS